MLENHLDSPHIHYVHLLKYLFDSYFYMPFDIYNSVVLNSLPGASIRNLRDKKVDDKNQASNYEQNQATGPSSENIKEVVESDKTKYGNFFKPKYIGNDNVFL